MPEKEKEGKKRIERGEETKQNKPSLWSRIKKPLLTGVMAAGLLIAPMKKAEGVGFKDIRGPPIYMESVIEKDKDLRTGWKLIRKVYDDLTGKEMVDDNVAKSYLKYAINHYKKVYEKTGKVGAFYLSAYGEYLNSQYDPTLEGTEKICLEVVKEMDKILEKNPNDFHALDLKIFTYFNLAKMYYDAHNLDPLYVRERWIDYGKLEEGIYKKKVREYADKFFEMYKKLDFSKIGFKSFDLEKVYSEEEIANALRDYKSGLADCNKLILEMLDKLKMLDNLK